MKKDEMRKLYKTILNTEYKNKKIWEHIKHKTLTMTRDYEGELYNNSDVRLMIVGRAMNGWETDFSTISSLDEMADEIIKSTYNFNDVTNKTGFESKTRKRPYRYITSKFWRLIKYVLEEYSEANKEWYGDNKNWNKKIVWSNLYKVSPWEANNPNWDLIQLNIQEYIDILKSEIETYKPKRILFITDNNFLEPHRRLPSFVDALDIKKCDCGCIVGTGRFECSKIIVCKRPDVWGTTNDYIKTMAKEIKEKFESI